MNDSISRQAAIDVLDDEIAKIGINKSYAVKDYVKMVKRKLKKLPSTQSERDVPIKPIETTDKAWGIPSRQAVCPKCGCYLGHIAFLDCYKGKRITYCETCGQAIDWEGWEFDE